MWVRCPSTIDLFDKAIERIVVRLYNAAAVVTFADDMGAVAVAIVAIFNGALQLLVAIGDALRGEATQ